MQSALAAFLIALAVGALLTPLVRRMSVAIGAVDRPGGRRTHQGVIPRLGGIAIVLAFFAPMVVLYLLWTGVAQIFYETPWRIIGLGAGGALIALIGIVDDTRGVRARTKLAIQIAAALIAFFCGFRIDAISLPIVGYMEMGIFAAPVTVLWIIGIVNAVNLIDGIDGLAGGVAFLACVANFVIGFVNVNPFVMLLSAALGGAVLAFLIYNFNPATIFMGDTGSMFLGFVLALTGLMGAAVKSTTTVTILVPCLALGMPIAETLLTIVRRFVSGRPIFTADRGHIHHRLLDLGLTHRRAVLILYGISVIFVGTAVLVSIGRIWEVGGALVVAAILGIGLVFFVRTTERRRLAREQGAADQRVEAEAERRIVPLRASASAALLQLGRAHTPEDLHAALAALCREGGVCGANLQRGQDAWAWSDGVVERREVETLPIPLGEDASLTFTLPIGTLVEQPQAETILRVVAQGVALWLAQQEPPDDHGDADADRRLRPAS